MKRGQPARTEESMQTAKGGHDVRLMDEHIAADHGIERSQIGNRRAELALRKKHVGAAVRLSAASRGVDGVGRSIHSHDEAARTNHVGREESGVAHAATNIEHAQARCDPRGPPDRFRDAPQIAGLLL